MKQNFCKGWKYKSVEFQGLKLKNNILQGLNEKLLNDKH